MALQLKLNLANLFKGEDKIRLEDLHQYDEDIGNYCSLGGERSESPVNPRVHHSTPTVAGTGMEQEKRIRREIANSNERRRMQSINAGFQSLRTLLPHHEGEKLSKAAILQQTAEYIYQLEQEKTRLLSQNCHLKRLLNQHEGEASATSKKRKADDLEVDTNVAGSTNDLIDVRVQLDRERRLRMILEEQVRSLESQLYPERIREITQQVQLQYQQREELQQKLVEDSGAVITPMRREGGAAETIAAVANLQVVAANALQPVAHTETVIATVTSPPTSPRLPSILEAAIKAEPKVEVERLPSPHSVHEERMSQARVYLASTSRQNLETIVEAIRHLEGDNLFSDNSDVAAVAAAAAAAASGNIVTTAAGGGGGVTVPQQQAQLQQPQHHHHHHHHHQQQHSAVTATSMTTTNTLAVAAAAAAAAAKAAAAAVAAATTNSSSSTVSSPAATTTTSTIATPTTTATIVGLNENLAAAITAATNTTTTSTNIITTINNNNNSSSSSSSSDDIIVSLPQQDAPLALTNKHHHNQHHQTSSTSAVAAATTTNSCSSTTSSPDKQHLIKVKMNQYLQFHQQQRPGVIVVKQHT